MLKVGDPRGNRPKKPAAAAEYDSRFAWTLVNILFWRLFFSTRVPCRFLRVKSLALYTPPHRPPSTSFLALCIQVWGSVSGVATQLPPCLPVAPSITYQESGVGVWWRLSEHTWQNDSPADNTAKGVYSLRPE